MHPYFHPFVPKLFQFGSRVLALTALLFAALVRAESGAGQPLPTLRPGLREAYTPRAHEIYRAKEKRGDVAVPSARVLAKSSLTGAEPSDALANNNAGSDGTSFFTQSETTIAAFGNTVVIGFNDSGSNAGGGNKFTGFAYSTDGGATFTDGGTLPTNAGGDAGDPVLSFDQNTGRLYFATLGFSTSTIQIFHSDDNGVTWSAPVNGTPGGTSEDKEWMVVDNFAGAGNGNVYLISRRFGGSEGIYMFRSTDQGNTFSPSGGTLIVPDSKALLSTWAPTTRFMPFGGLGIPSKCENPLTSGLRLVRR